jgi:SAM-dependent methyltransferase
MSAFHYTGDELALFGRARRWKRYLAKEIAPFVRGKVLEVGAGIGGTTRLFEGRARDAWTCLEPDAGHAAELRDLESRGELAPKTRVILGTLRDLDGAERFDTILYVDVLEHVAEDADELRDAAERLSPGGHLVVLGPAHAGLYSPFDRAIGHYRRYSLESLHAIAPPALSVVRERYLDSVGLLASLANRAVLHEAHPTPRQVLFWDRVLVRASTWVDPLFSFRLGKSVLVVWQRAESESRP